MVKDQDHRDDHLIWKAFKNGNQEAYAKIYEKYFKALFNYGYKICKDEELVKDCIHDLFVEIWHSRKQLQDPPSIKNYLLKSIRNKIARTLKSNRYVNDDHPLQLEFYVDLSQETKIVNDQLLHEKHNVLKNAITQLTPRQKEALYLLYFDNLSVEEIAEITGVKPKTIYNIINNGIQSLRKRLNKSDFLTFFSFLFF